MKSQLLEKKAIRKDHEGRNEMTFMQNNNGIKIIESFYVITPSREHRQLAAAGENSPISFRNLFWLYSSEITEYSVQITNYFNHEDFAIDITESTVPFADLPLEVKEDLRALIIAQADELDSLQLNPREKLELMADWKITANLK